MLRRGQAGPEREEREQVVEILRLARELGEAEQQSLDQPAQAQESARQERQIAEAERAGGRPQHDHEVGEIVGERAEAGEESTATARRRARRVFSRSARAASPPKRSAR